MTVDARSRAAALIDALEDHAASLDRAADRLGAAEQQASVRLGGLCADVSSVARRLDPDASSRVSEPNARRSSARADRLAGDALADHPAVLDAERLVREADRAARRSAAPASPGTESGRTQRQLAFLLSFCGFLGIGLVLTRLGGTLPGDAVSRVQAAQAVWYGRDPHLESIGFIWGPFPTLFEVPFAWLRAWWPAMTGDAVAAVVVSALFMAGVVNQLIRWGEESGARSLMRIAVAVAVVAHPLIWVYGANGMSEACWLFFLMVVARRLALWSETDDVRHLAYAGAAAGAAYLVRYESLAVVVAVTVVVGVTTWLRWHPVVDDPSFGTPGWDHDRDRARRTALDVTIFALPAVAAVAGWAFASWVIIGEPFAQFTSEYGNSAIVERAGDMGNIVPDTTSLGRAWFYLVQVLTSAPAAAVLAVVAFAVAKASNRRVVAALAVFGTPIAVQTMFSYQGSTFPWFRYSISAVVLSGLLVLVLGPAAAWLRWLAVAALVPGVLVSTTVMRSGDLGTVDDVDAVRQLEAVVAGDADRNEAWLGRAARIAADIDAMPDVEAGAVICDASVCFPVLANAPRPEAYVIPSDRDFQPIAANPGRFGVRYILLGDPGSTGADAIVANFPGIWDAEGAPIAEVVKEWGDEDEPRTHYRLLRIKEPKGDPRPRPTEELTG